MIDTGNGNVAAKTGNNLYLELRQDGNSDGKCVGFAITESSKKVCPGDCDNDRQPEMAIWPPKPEIHISVSRNITDSIEIPTEDLGFSTTASSKELFASD